MASDHTARLIAESDRCMADAARIRALAARLDRPEADDLLAIAARLEESAVRLRSLAQPRR